MIKKLEGIIVSEVDYKESSKIINIYTKEEGIIGCLARGSKRLKSNLSGVSSKFTYGYFHINYKENGMSTLMEVDIIDNFKNIKKDIENISYVAYITELVTQVFKHENNKNIYNLYIDSIKKINDMFDPMVITNILELKLLDNLGIRPVIDGCVSCGNMNGIVTISSYKGGYLCHNCLNNEKIVHTKTIKLIRMFYYVDIAKIEKIDISDTIKNEINEFIDDYYDRYSGLYLKSKTFLKNLNKIY